MGIFALRNPAMDRYSLRWNFGANRLMLSRGGCIPRFVTTSTLSMVVDGEQIEDYPERPYSYHPHIRLIHQSRFSLSF